MVIDKLKKHMDKANKKEWKYRQPRLQMLNKLQTNGWHMQKAKLQVSSEVQSFRRHVSQNFWTLAISTFGIVNGLVWYDVWNTVVNQFFPERNTLLLKIYVAIIMTSFSITATYFVTKLRDRKTS
jgi:Family of unknown function (DUF5654)